MEFFFHPTAKAHPSVIFGEGCHIGPGVVIKQNVVIAQGTVIQGPCFIGPNTSIIRYQPDLVYSHPPEISIVIAPFVVIGANCVIAASICPNVTIGAMSLVREEILVHGTYVGVPCRRIWSIPSIQISQLGGKDV